MPLIDSGIYSKASGSKIKFLVFFSGILLLFLLFETQKLFFSRRVIFQQFGKYSAFGENKKDLCLNRAKEKITVKNLEVLNKGGKRERKKTRSVLADR